jgi:hypothetical protein
MRTFIDLSVGLAFFALLYFIVTGFKWRIKLERGEGVILAWFGLFILVLTIVFKM